MLKYYTLALYKSDKFCILVLIVLSINLKLYPGFQFGGGIILTAPHLSLYYLYKFFINLIGSLNSASEALITGIYGIFSYNKGQRNLSSC